MRFVANDRRKTMLSIVGVSLLGVAGSIAWYDPIRPGDKLELDSSQIAMIDFAIKDGIFWPTAGMVVKTIDRLTVAHIGAGREKVLFVGDSVLLQYGPRVQELLQEGLLTKRVIFVAGPSCSPIPGAPRPDSFARCSVMSRTAGKIIRNEGVQTVVLGALWQANRGPNAFVKYDGIQMAIITTKSLAFVYKTLNHYIACLNKHGAAVYTILSTPTHPRFNPARMISRSMIGYKVASDAFDGISMQAIMDPLRDDNERLASVANATGAALINPLPEICGTALTCSPLYNEGDPKFADELHLRPDFVAGHVRMLDHLLTRSP